MQENTSKHVLLMPFLPSLVSFCSHFQDTVYNSDEVKLRFMNAMHSIAKVTGKAVATAFDLSRFKTACDLGGEDRTRSYTMVF